MESSLWMSKAQRALDVPGVKLLRCADVDDSRSVVDPLECSQDSCHARRDHESGDRIITPPYRSA